MSELRFNPLTGRWVAIAVDRASRPHDFAPRLEVPGTGEHCPFCPGHEEDTPPALESYGRHGNWLVRVVPNLYPAFDGRADFSVHDVGPVFRQAPGTGIHEVLVLSPDHRASWADLPDKQVGLVMAAVRDRLEDHALHTSVRYTQTIVNHGREAGASLEHPHGQLLGLPFVPEELTAELAGFERFATDHPEHADRDGADGACLLCATAAEEQRARHRLVHADDDVVVVCPFWSATPYEMLVLPTAHQAHLDQAQPGDLVAVGRAVRDVLAVLGRAVGDVAYNLVVHTAPHHSEAGYHWHVHVLPRITSVAGFEAGTGVLINIVAPEDAAGQLRRAWPSDSGDGRSLDATSSDRHA